MRARIAEALRRELRSSKELLDSVMRNAPAVIIRYDRRGRIEYINRTLPGFSREKVIGSRCYEYIDTRYHKLVRAALRAVFKRGDVVAYELRGQGAHGQPRWYATTLGPLREGWRVKAAVGISTDVTELRRAQEDLQNARERLAGIFESSRDAINFVTLNGTLIDVNDAMCRLVGYARDELVNRRTFHDLTPKEYRPLDEEAMRRLLETGEPVEFEKEYRRKDGARIPVSLTCFVVRGNQGRPAGFAAIIRNITERKRLEKEILAIGAREQSRIGRELHDSLGQSLTGISFMAKSLKSRLSQSAAAEAAIAEQIAQAASGAVEQVRALAAGLVPAELLPNGLPAALRALAEQAERSLGLRCTVSCPKSIAKMEDASLLHLYRIAQEAVSNAAKHASARLVRVDVREKRGRVELTVSDDGVGLRRSNGAGMGLRIMEHRARLLDGTFEVRRGARGGTTVFCSCPIPRRETRARS